MFNEFINDVNVNNVNWHLEDPYYYVRIDAIDHSEIDFINFTSFTPSASTQTVKSMPHEYFTWIGPANNVASMTFTKLVNFPSKDKYLFEMMIWNKQTVANSDNVDVKVGATSIYTGNGHQAWNDYGKIIRIPITKIAKGNQEVKVTVPQNCMLGWMRISRLTRFEGGREYNGPSDTRLDLISANFTQNGITDIDKLELNIAMKPEYWDYNGYNILRFDFGDHITLALGEDMADTVPMFGGYIEGWDISDDNKTLKLTCVNRLYDLKRTHILKNMKLGGAKLGQDGAISPYSKFGSIQDAARYLCTSLYNINWNAISKDYVCYNIFESAGDVSGLTSVGFEKRWETSFGTNGSSCTVRPTKPGTNSLTLYSEGTGLNWDATVYDQFGFDYYVSGAGIKYPIKFNIEIDMFMTNQEPVDKLTYVLHFNGPTPSGTKVNLSNLPVTFNGAWQSVDVNLHTLFKTKAKASASVIDPSKANYYITEIRLVGQQDNLTVLDRRCSSFTIDNIIGFRSFDKTMTFSTTDVPTAYDELLDICNRSNYMAWIRPGMERYEDQMIFLPKNFYTLPVGLGEMNIKNISGLSYHPIESGMINYVRGIFKYDDYRQGFVTQADSESIKHYLPIGETEVLSGMNSLEAANTQMQKRLEAKNKVAEAWWTKNEAAIKKKHPKYKTKKYEPYSFVAYTSKELNSVDSQVDYLLKQNINSTQHNYVGFDVTIEGSTLLEPGQFARVLYAPKRIDGIYSIESIRHNLDFVNGSFETELSLNIPAQSFRNYKKKIDELTRRLRTVESNAAYNSSGAKVGGMETSLGAYS